MEVCGLVKSNIELKNCPFCGSEAEFWETQYEGIVVICRNGDCGAEQRFFATKEEAAASWNRRICTCRKEN